MRTHRAGKQPLVWLGFARVRSVWPAWFWLDFLSVRLGLARFGLGRLALIWFSSVGPGLAWFGLARFASAWLSLAQFGLVGSVWLGLARVGSGWLGWLGLAR